MNYDFNRIKVKPVALHLTEHLITGFVDTNEVAIASFYAQAREGQDDVVYNDESYQTDEFVQNVIAAAKIVDAAAPGYPINLNYVAGFNFASDAAEYNALNNGPWAEKRVAGWIHRQGHENDAPVTLLDLLRAKGINTRVVLGGMRMAGYSVIDLRSSYVDDTLCSSDLVARFFQEEGDATDIALASEIVGDREKMIKPGIKKMEQFGSQTSVSAENSPHIQTCNDFLSKLADAFEALQHVELLDDRDEAIKASNRWVLAWYLMEPDILCLEGFLGVAMKSQNFLLNCLLGVGQDTTIKWDPDGKNFWNKPDPALTAVQIGKWIRINWKHVKRD